MKDTEILDLYFDRNEQAITETQTKYGSYCFSIAFHILHDQEDSDECVNDTWMRAGLFEYLFGDYNTESFF